jgi:diguanylate cyclase (GGDEF)-like protein
MPVIDPGWSGKIDLRPVHQPPRLTAVTRCRAGGSYSAAGSRYTLYQVAKIQTLMAILRTFSAVSKRRATYRYLGAIAIMIALIVSSSYLGFAYRTDALLNSLLLEEARAFDQQLRLVRSWAREHGGLYVRHGGSSVTNASAPPQEIGRELTYLNTSEVTQELSELSRRAGIVQFRSTSFSPLNAANQPDDFEERALARLRSGEEEVFSFEQTATGTVFRYLSPLRTEKGCLNCHENDGFQPGRVDSALSFSIPADRIARDKRLNLLWMAASSLLIIGIASTSIWWLARRFNSYLHDADQRLETMACQDQLTGLKNRTIGMDLLRAEISRAKRNGLVLCVAIIDIDHFKRVNDRSGHMAGDQALRSFADVLSSTVRDYDIAFRYGGEEFVLVMPHTPIENAIKVAENLRLAVERLVIETQSGPLSITISTGIEQYEPNMTLEDLLGRADKALYRAKQGGRNRTVTSVPAPDDP